VLRVEPVAFLGPQCHVASHGEVGSKRRGCLPGQADGKHTPTHTHARAHTHTHSLPLLHTQAGGSTRPTPLPFLPGGGVAAGPYCAHANEREREVFTVCAVSARILSTSEPLRKRWNLACLGSSKSGPANTNLLHWILPEHGQAAVRFILRAKEELADLHQKNSCSIRTQILVIDEDSIGDILWCTLTVLAPASRATQMSGRSAILLEASFDAPASAKHTARPVSAARQASFALHCNWHVCVCIYVCIYIHVCI